MAQAFVRGVAIVLAFVATVPIKSFAQSIGPDGKVLAVYSGVNTPPPAVNPPTAPRVGSPAAPVPTTPTNSISNTQASAIITTPLLDKSSVGNAPPCPSVAGAYYLQSNGWLSMDPSHSVGYKTTNVAGTAFTYGATKARVKAQFRDAHSPYQLRSDGFAMCLVGITDSGRDITVAKFQEEKDRREISMGSYRIWTGINAQIDSKIIIPVSVEKKGDKIYLVTNKERLPQGEFILFTIIPDVAAMSKANTPTSLGGYDFGHHQQ
jgi:hypothetical protein